MARHHLEIVSFVAALFSIVQSVVWFALSVVIMACYTCQITSDQKLPYTIKDYVVAYFQGECRYLTQNLWNDLHNCTNSLTSPQSLVGWASVIFTINTLLLASSIALLTVLLISKKVMYILCLYIYLFFNTFVIILDLGITSVIATDIALFSETLNCGNGVDPNVASLSLLALDIVASKGIILWLGNICFTIYLLVAAAKLTGCVCSLDMSYKDEEDEVNDKYLYMPSKLNHVRDKEELNMPIEIIQASQTLPAHTAKARWPSLGLQSPAAQPSRLSDHEVTGRPTFLRDPYSRQQIGSHSAPVTLPRQENHFPRTTHTDESRPMSLEEAIRTMRPLKHVKNSRYRT